MRNLKSEILRLLKEDEEFRYAIAGLIGLEEILKRLDRHEAQLVKLREDMNKLREDMNRGFKRYDEELIRLREDMNKLREDMNEGFQLLRSRVGAPTHISRISPYRRLVRAPRCIMMSNRSFLTKELRASASVISRLVHLPLKSPLLRLIP